MPDDLPSEIASEQSAPRSRKTIIVISLSVVVLVLAAITLAAVLLLRNSAGTNDLDQLRSLLPGSEDAARTIETPTSTPAPLASATPSPSATATPQSQSNGNNLAVTVRFNQNPSFNLNIDDIQKTSTPPTVQLYEPNEGSAYSILRIKNDQGGVVTEHRFRVGTLAIGEGFGQESVSFNVEESIVYLVLPLTLASGSVEIVSPDGQIFDQQTFSFSTSLLDQAKRVLGLANEAQAQQEDVFTIVVINNDNATANQVQGVAGQVTAMANSISPWNKFAQQGKIQVVPVFNVGPPINCDAVNEVGYPICRNDAAVIQAVTRAGVVSEWDAIVVITNNPCECGTVLGHFPPITAVGRGASARLIAHEFGHSVAKMTDEYGFQRGWTGPPGPNCFATQQACVAATEPFPAAQCSSGCISVNTWRPASRIMFNVYQPLEYGPLEECIMNNAIASAIGDETDDRCITPETNASDDSLYWGWRR